MWGLHCFFLFACQIIIGYWPIIIFSTVCELHKHCELHHMGVLHKHCELHHMGVGKNLIQKTLSVHQSLKETSKSDFEQKTFFYP
jgi:hypothetical protein